MAELVGKELEEYLKTIVNTTEENNHKVWVCSGDGRNTHTPIIGYGGGCPFCEYIGDSNFEYEEMKLERDEVKVTVDRLTEKLETLEEELEEATTNLEDCETKSEERNEKLLAIYEIYPECGI